MSKPLDSGLRRAAAGILPSRRIQDFLSVNDGRGDSGLCRAVMGILGGLFPTPLYYLGGWFQTPLYHLDRLFQTRSTTYIPVGVHPCRRASL